MKRYILFAGSMYYPEGGWKDYKGTDDDINALIKNVAMGNYSSEWWQIVDTETGQIVEEKKNYRD